jgi:hypothetical protein
MLVSCSCNQQAIYIWNTLHLLSLGYTWVSWLFIRSVVGVCNDQRFARRRMCFICWKDADLDCINVIVLWRQIMVRTVDKCCLQINRRINTVTLRWIMRILPQQNRVCAHRDCFLSRKSARILRSTTHSSLIVRVKSLHLPEGQTGNAWEPAKPMINYVPPTRSVSHYHPLLSLFSLLQSHRRNNLKSHIALTRWTL